jgi:elongation factor 3
MISKSAVPSTVAPTHEEILSFFDAIFTAKTSQASLDAAYALTNVLINSVGFRGFRDYGVLNEIKKAAADKKDGARRESAMILLGALFERFPPAQPITEVVFLLQDGGIIAPALDALADKGAVVRESAQYALDALFTNLKPESMVVGLLPALSQYLSKRTGKWQGTVGAYELIGRLADKAKMGLGSKEEEKLKDILRESMGNRLASLIPIVESGMHDLKSEVRIRIYLCATSPLTLLAKGYETSNENYDFSHNPSI